MGDDAIFRNPIVGSLARWAYRCFVRRPAPFPGSNAYWDERYATGGNSGDGSYGRHAEFKAEVLNGFVAEHGVRTVVELGCGDGHQLSLARYPSYLGIDVSPTAVSWCSARFASDATKVFRLAADHAGEWAELALSLDVIYHLVEDDVFRSYMRRLFDAAERFVIIYSSNFDAAPEYHVRHRRFTSWIDANEPSWRLVRHVPNRHPFLKERATGSLAEFYIFERPAAAQS